MSLLCEIETRLPLEGEFTLCLFQLKEILHVFVSSKETIRKSFPVSHLKVKKKKRKKRKPFCSKSHSCSFSPCSSEALSGSREIFFCRECYHQLEAEHTAVGIRGSKPRAEFSPPPSTL